MITLDMENDMCQSATITTLGHGFDPAPCVSHSPIVGEIKSHGGKRPGAGRKPKSVAEPDLDTPRWYCVRTEYGGETAADMAIRQAGFTTFYPLLWVAPVAAHRSETGRMMPARAERLVPLFPRYLFVSFAVSDPAWRHIPTMRGVEGIFSTTPTRPIPVPVSALDPIRVECMPNGAIYPKSVEAVARARRQWVDWSLGLRNYAPVNA